MSDKPDRVSLPTLGEVFAQIPADDLLRGCPAVESPLNDTTVTGVVLTEEQREQIEEQALAVLRTCYDPELPVNLVELGLIYRLEVLANGVLSIDMTLTAPNCPVAGSLPAEVRSKLKSIKGVADARVRLVWEPPWTRDRMSDAARLELGLFG
jgi:FeS assembly SUF system protein